MPKLVDLTGQRFGDWTVNGRAASVKPKNGKGTKTMWHCTCDCKNERIIHGSSLKRGISKSCGHITASRLAPGEAAFRTAQRTYTFKEGYDWGLSVEQFRALCLSDCFYCDAPPSIPVKSRCDPTFLRNGIDRWNNEKYYWPENSVPCCRECNWAKKEMTGAEYLAWMERGARFRHPEAFACEAVLEAGNVEIEAAKVPTMQ